MIRRLLGWLRHTGDPVVQQPAPDEPSPRAAEFEARERLIAELDAHSYEALQYGAYELMDRLIDERLALRAPRPRVLAVRPSVPVVPGRTT